MEYLWYLLAYLHYFVYFFFFFNDTATTEIYTLSLHDALPSCLNRARSSVVSPGRRPASRSARRTQLRSVSPAHPIFSAIEVIAAHCDACSWVCSNTIRTARSRTSGENRLGLAMTPSSQGMEPPINPGRFSRVSP